MRTAAFALIFAFAALAAAMAAPPPQADAAALRTLANAADLAWNAADVDGMAAYYSPDATLQVTGRGDQLVGREAIRAYFGQAFARRPGVFRHVTEVRRMDALDRDTVVSDASIRRTFARNIVSQNPVTAPTVSTPIPSKYKLWREETNRCR